MSTSGGEGGGAVAGAAIVHAHPFTFDTPGLATGTDVYLPKVGDIWLDAWVEVDTAWDGATPAFDVGYYAQGYGVFGAGVLPVSLANADYQGLTNLLTGAGAIAAGYVSPVTLTSLATKQANFVAGGGYRYLPGKWTSDDALAIWVTSTGYPGGADPGATMGAATLYMVTATPA